MTRRILKPQPVPFRLGEDGDGPECEVAVEIVEDGPPRVRLGRVITEHVAARWRPGDLLWVREALTARPMANFLTGEPTNAVVAAYAADDEDVVEKHGFNLVPWWSGGEEKLRGLPSIHMPRWASRITLRVTDLKVERLQDIREDEAVAEGMIWQEPTGEDERRWRDYCAENDTDHQKDTLGGVWLAPGTKRGFGQTAEDRARPLFAQSAKLAFLMTWNSIHRTGTWDANPFVSVTTFERT